MNFEQLVNSKINVYLHNYFFSISQSIFLRCLRKSQKSCLHARPIRMEVNDLKCNFKWNLRRVYPLFHVSATGAWSMFTNYSARSARWRTYADVDRSFSSADAVAEAPLLEQSL